ILLEFLYPLQNLLLKGISVTNEISKALTIIEDNNGIIQIPFDDEGIKTEKKLICKNGNIIPTSFKNLEDGVSSGNGFRKDYRRKPKKAPLIWRVSPGLISLDDLTNTLKEYVLIDTMVQGRIDEHSGYLIST